MDCYRFNFISRSFHIQYWTEELRIASGNEGSGEMSSPWDEEPPLEDPMPNSIPTLDTTYFRRPRYPELTLASTAVAFETGFSRES